MKNLKFEVNLAPIAMESPPGELLCKSQNQKATKGSSFGFAAFCQLVAADLKCIAGIAYILILVRKFFINNINSHQKYKPAKGFFEFFTVDKFIEPNSYKYAYDRETCKYT